MCWSLDFIEWIVLRIILIIFVVALIRIWLPMLATRIPWIGGPLAATVDLILWFAVAVLVVVIIFSLLACLFSGGMGGLFYHHASAIPDYIDPLKGNAPDISNLTALGSYVRYSTLASLGVHFLP